MRILIAEDEPDMQKILRIYLEKEGHEVSSAYDGKEAFEHLCSNSFDLLIADWMMPIMSGLELLKEIRRMAMPVKVIMLTAKSDTEDEIKGLSTGADDYIKKPFEPRILILRINKLMKQEEILSCGSLSLNQQKKAAFLGQEEMKLTNKEFLLLQYFMKNKGLTLTRDALLDAIWGTEYDGDERTLDTHIRRLRNKIGKEYIKTYVGIGYRMEAFDE